MSDKEEVELKLQLGTREIAVLLADPLIANHDPVTRDQSSIYFDTEKRALNAAGLSLRIRTSGGKRIQTIKTESKATASLFARGEWERNLHDDRPMLDDAPAILTAITGAKDRGDLRPVFTVEVNRTSIAHRTGGNRVELVVDRGRVVIGDRDTPIAEVELELLCGNREAIFELAYHVATLVPVRLGVQSKSERGYVLLAGKEALSLKAEPITLARDSDTATMFEAIAGGCIRQFRLNEDRLLASGSPASLHQARVALRRLRSALSTFKAMLEGPELDRFQSAFRDLAAALGTVRDVDVMIAKIDHDGALERLRAARQQRFGSVLRQLNSDDVRHLMLEFVEWLSIGAWRQREELKKLRDASAHVTAARTLDRLRRKIKHHGKHLAQLDEHDRHRVRIIGKKLRYSAEFFGDLYRGKKARHRQADFLETIEMLQTALGHLNDLASGRDLFEALGIQDADIILATGKKADTKRLLSKAEHAHRDLIDMKRFWR